MKKRLRQTLCKQPTEKRVAFASEEQFAGSLSQAAKTNTIVNAISNAKSFFILRSPPQKNAR